MTRIFKLRPKADKDLIKIYKHSIKEWGDARADKYIMDAENIFQELADNPALGYDASYVVPQLRAFPVVSHVVFYKSTNYGIMIIRVLHKSMDSRNHI